MVTDMGLNIVLHLTLCLVLVSVDISGQSPADTQFEQQHFALNITQNNNNISEVQIGSLKSKLMGTNTQENESSIKRKVASGSSEIENTATQKYNSGNGSINEMQQSKATEEYNDINKNNTKNQEWNPSVIGVATWYEISLTGRRMLYKGEDRVESGKHTHSSSSRAVTSLKTNSQIGLLIVLIKFIVQH